MARFKVAATLLLSVVLVQCSKKENQEVAAAPPPSPPPPAAASAPSEQMTPASGTVTATSPTPAPTTATPETSSPAPAALSDEQIIKVLELANGAEVEEGKLATTKAKMPKVKSFAAKMVEHHGKGKAKTNTLATKLSLKPEESTLSTELKSSAESSLSTLKGAAAGDFDRMYIAAQVDEHKKLLAAIDEKMMPNAKSPELKTLLQETRTTVESHLSEAQQLQTDIAAMPAKP